MTDARFPERYLSDRRVLRLSADEFRAWSFATLWCVSNRTDGVVLADELPLIPFMDDGIAGALVERGLWSLSGDGWLITDFDRTQTSKHDLEVLENARAADAAKKRRLRAAKKEQHERQTPRFTDVPGTVRGTSPGRVPEDITGEAGRDEGTWYADDETGEITDPSSSVPAPSVTTWDVAPIGRSCTVCGTSMAGYPDSMQVCASQDDDHNNYRAQHGWAA